MKIITNLASGLLYGALALGALMPQKDARAQDSGDGAMALEEITVTARRRDENLQNVPVSVQAFSAETLQRNNIINFEDVATRTPGMVFTQSTPLDHEIFIRGIGSDIQGAGADNAVGFFVDGIYMSRNTGSQLGLYDLERVEVLRGPQSLRFGKNVVGGLVHYVTKKPTEEFEGDFGVTVGDYNQVDVTGAVRGPISDTVMFSVAGGSNQRDGYATNTLGGDAEDMNRTGVRGKLLFRPNENLDILLAADYNRTRAAGRWVHVADPGTSEAVTFNGFFAPPIPGLPADFTLPDRNAPFQDSDPRSGPRNHTGANNSDLAGLSATIDWDNGNGFSLQSITAYRDAELLARDDGCGIFWDHPMIPSGDGLNVPDPSDSIVGDVFTYLDEVPDCWFDQLKTDDVSQFSQELRLTWDNGGRAVWSGGVYFLDEEIDRSEQVAFSFPDFNVITDWAFSIAFGGAPSGIVETEGVSNAETSSDAQNLGVFFETDIALSDNFALNAGLRWVRDEKDFSVRRFGDTFDEAICEPDGMGVLPPGCLVAGEFETSETQSWDEILPALSLTYSPSDDTTMYLRYEKGYKPGGYTGEGAGQPTSALVSFDAEFANAFEGGAKLLLADQRVRLNIAGHFTDYEDLQTQQFIAADPTRPPDNFVVNASDGTEAYGVEIDFEAIASDNISLYGNYAWTKCEFSGELIIDDDGTDVNGNTCRRTPENAFNLGGLVQFPVRSNRVVRFDVNYQYQDEYFFDNENSENLRIDSEHTLNFNGGIAADDGAWDLNFWVKNATDELNVANVLDLFGTLYLNYQAPRTYGVTYRQRF